MSTLVELPEAVSFLRAIARHYEGPARDKLTAAADALSARLTPPAEVVLTRDALDALDKPSPEGLTPDERLIWILGDLMNGVENYFGAENPKRRGHIYSAALRIIDDILSPERDALAASEAKRKDAEDDLAALRKALSVEITPRRPLDDDGLTDYLESSKDYVLNNVLAAETLLDIALDQPKTEDAP